MTYHLKFRFIRRWASAAFAGIALVAQSAHADQGADLAIRLLQGVLEGVEKTNYTKRLSNMRACASQTHAVA